MNDSFSSKGDERKSLYKYFFGIYNCLKQLKKRRDERGGGRAGMFAYVI